MSITYSRAFTDNVKGQLKARFRLDRNGVPIHEDANGMTQYSINLSLEAPGNARRIDSVTYYLDEATFFDPVRASNHRTNDFTQEISSYGDFEVEAAVQMGGQDYVQRALLSSLLEAGHAGDDSPAIRAALNAIRSH